MATSGTARYLNEHNLPAQEVAKINQADRDLLHEIKDGNIDLVLNTITRGKIVESEWVQIRQAAVENGLISMTSIDTFMGATGSH